jgi:hypothetical protein
LFTPRWYDTIGGVTEGKSALAALLLVLSACSSTRNTPLPQPPAASVCRACFWNYQPETLKTQLVAIYSEKRFADPLLEAQRRMLVATITEDAAAACQARAAFARLRGSSAVKDPARDLFVAETLAFTAAPCGADPGSAFRRAAAKARHLSASFKADVYDALADGRFAPRFGEAAIAKHVEVPPGVTSFILGSTKIVVGDGALVGAQVERTVRDWLSYQLSWDGARGAVPETSLLTWHEGGCLRRLLDVADVKVLPLTGALAVRHGGRWLAADGAGVFRFAVLDDKIQYPTTLVYGDVALLVDTHGISSLVEPARRAGASLVVGCGDTEDKMKAAFELARDGVDVWFPCDRFVGNVLGYDAPGVLLGSAPVRREGIRAVIGDRPIRFEVDEQFVAEDFLGTGPLRYYDAAARYFRALSERLPLKVDYVAVDGAGQSERVVRRAEALSASAIGVRVQTGEDAAPVRAWLAASSRHRAVLLHTVPYPDGYALFDAFPTQTTFADPRPVFTKD